MGLVEVSNPRAMLNVRYVFFEELFSEATTNALYDFVGVARQTPTIDQRINTGRSSRPLDPETIHRARRPVGGRKRHDQ